MSVSPTLAAQQWPTIRGMTTGLLLSWLPAPIKHRLFDPTATQRQIVPPCSRSLVDQYLAWSGADPERYAHTLPAHFFSKYGLELVSRLCGLAPVNMLQVVNQGCRFRVYSLIPRDVPIHLSGRLVDCSDQGSRVRVHTQVQVGWEEQPQAMSVDIYAAVLRGRSPRAKKQAQQAASAQNFRQVGHWSADRADGQRFFYLTGDFNPIHTVWPLARRSKFGGCILHGFGTLARSWECVQADGSQISDADLRFVKPNLLPQPRLNVELATQDSTTTMRVVDPQGAVYLAGQIKREGASQ
nr:hypothetical protein [Oceanococcus sp. HetDA_MAG_MS8]